MFDGVDRYTRRGDFQPDKNGYLVNGAGYYLMGIPVDPTTGNLVGSVPQVLQFQNDFLPAQATTQIDYRANLASYSRWPSSTARRLGTARLRAACIRPIFTAGCNPPDHRHAGHALSPTPPSTGTRAVNNKADGRRRADHRRDTCCPAPASTRFADAINFAASATPSRVERHSHHLRRRGGAVGANQHQRSPTASRPACWPRSDRDHRHRAPPRRSAAGCDHAAYRYGHRTCTITQLNTRRHSAALGFTAPP